MKYIKDTITGFYGSWGSGIATLKMNRSAVACENAPTVRALDDRFDNVSFAGHTVNQDAIVGKEIVYWMDDMGLVMGGFIAYEDWLDSGYPELEDGQAHDIKGITEGEYDQLNNIFC